MDIGDNGMVEYTLAGDIEKHFMMEPETGKIKLATPFDPNQQNIDYVLMVQAMDKGFCLYQGERTKFDRFVDPNVRGVSRLLYSDLRIYFNRVLSST